MKDATKKPGGWSAVRQQLAAWDKSALLALVKDLYEVAAKNRCGERHEIHPRVWGH